MRIVEWIPPLFRDRAEAGRILSEAVAALELERPIVVGVARGGVAVAVEVARRLGAPLAAVDVERVLVARLRVGAATGNGPPYLSNVQDLPNDAVEAAVERARRAAAALEARLEL